MSFVLVLFLTQDQIGEKTLKKLEETILQAPAFSCTFRSSSDGYDDGLLLKGGLVLMKGEDKYSIVGEGGYCVFGADGGSVKKPGGQISVINRPDNLRSVAVANFVRVGGCLGLIAAQSSKNKDGGVVFVLGMPKISDIVREPDSGNKGAVSFKLAVPGKSKSAMVTLWYDLRTHLPIKRKVELVEADDDVLRVTEVYKEANTNAVIPDVKFRVPE